MCALGDSPTDELFSLGPEDWASKEEISAGCWERLFNDKESKVKESRAIMKILSLVLRWVSNRKILGRADPAFRHRSGFNELSGPLSCFSADSLHKNNGINIWKILPCYSKNGTYHLTRCETQILIPKKGILWSSLLQDHGVLQTLTKYLPSTPEVEKYFSMFTHGHWVKIPKRNHRLWLLIWDAQEQIFSASKVYLQIKFPIIVSFLHIPYQIPVVRVSRKSVTICEKLWVKWLAQHYVWNEVK